MAHVTDFGDDKLKALLHQAVERGYCSWTTFISFDKSGSGHVTPKYFRLGLEEAGIELQPALVSRLFTAISDGQPVITLEDFQRFSTAAANDAQNTEVQGDTLGSKIQVVSQLNLELDTAPHNDDGEEDLVQQLLEGTIDVEDVVEAFQYEHCQVLDGGATMQYKILGPQAVPKGKTLQSIVFVPDILDTIATAEAFFTPILEVANTPNSKVNLRVLLVQFPGQLDTAGNFPSLGDLEVTHDSFLSKAFVSLLVELKKIGVWGCEIVETVSEGTDSLHNNDTEDDEQEEASSKKDDAQDRNHVEKNLKASNQLNHTTDCPKHSPWICIGSGIGGHVASHMLSVEAKRAEFHEVFYNLQCAVFINTFATLDSNIAAIVNQLLYWENATMDDQKLMQMLYSRDYLTRHTLGQVVQQFWLNRSQLHHRGIANNTISTILEGVLTYRDLTENLVDIKWPCILVQATEDAFINPAHVKTYTKAFGHDAMNRVVGDCFMVGPADRCVGKSAEGDAAYSDEQIAAYERTCWSSTARFCLQWVKAGHEVMAERDEHLQGMIGKLLDQVTSAMFPQTQIMEYSVKVTTSFDQRTNDSITSPFAKLGERSGVDNQDQAPEGIQVDSEDEEDDESVSTLKADRNSESQADGNLELASDSDDSNSEKGLGNGSSNRWKQRTQPSNDLKASAKSTYEMMQQEEDERRIMAIEDDLSRSYRLEGKKQERWSKQVAISNQRIQQLRQARLKNERDPWLNLGNETSDTTGNGPRASVASIVPFDDGQQQDNQGGEIAPLGSGVARLRMDILKIRSQRKSLVYRVNQIHQRLKDTEVSLMEGENKLKELNRASYRLKKKRATVLSPTKKRSRKATSGAAKSNTQRIMDAANNMKQEIQVLEERIQTEELRVDQLKSKKATTYKKMMALNTNIQRLAISYSEKIKDLETSHERLLQQSKQTMKDLQASRRERDDALFRKADTLRQQHTLQVRLEEITEEVKRIKNWPGKHVDSDVWQKGVKQRIRLSDLKAYLAKESSTSREVLKGLHLQLDARSEELEQLCQRIYSLQNEEMNLLEQLKVTRELKVLVAHGTSIGNEVIGDDGYSSMETAGVEGTLQSKQHSDETLDHKTNIPLDEGRNLAEAVRYKHPDSRSPEEQLWAYYDQLMNPELYASSIDEAELHSEAFPQNGLPEAMQSEGLSVASLKRICTLPEGINIAIAFLRNSTEIEAHRLIQKYTFGRGEEELRMLDCNVHRIQLIKQQERDTSGEDAPRQSTCVFKSLEHALERGKLGEIETGMQVYIETETVEQIFMEDSLHLGCGEGKIFEFNVKDTDVFGELWASVVFKGSFHARGYVLGRISASMFKVIQDPQSDSEEETLLQPIGWAPYNKVALCSPDHLGKVVVSHSPFNSDMPVLPGKYQVVVGAASKASVSIAVYGKVINKVGTVVRDAVDRIKMLVERNKEVVADITEIATSLRLAERKLRLVTDMEEESKLKCNELEENMSTLAKTLQEAQENELDEYDDELQDPEAISRALVTLEGKFSSTVAIAASRKQERVDITSAIVRMNEIKVTLKNELKANREIVFRNKETIPPLLQLIHGFASNKPDKNNYEQSGKGGKAVPLDSQSSNADIVASSMWSLTDDDLNLEQVMNMTPAQRIRRQNQRGIPITPEEENWLRLDRILNPEMHSQLGVVNEPNAKIEGEEPDLDDEATKEKIRKDNQKEKEVKYMVDNDLGSGGDGNGGTVSVDFTREELLRCLTVDLQELNKEEHAVRKLLVKYHDQVCRPIEYKDVGMTVMEKLRNTKLSSVLVNLTVHEKWWIIHDALIHPENVTDTDMMAKVSAITRNTVLEMEGNNKPTKVNGETTSHAGSESSGTIAAQNATNARLVREQAERDARDPYLTREELLLLFASRKVDPELIADSHSLAVHGVGSDEVADDGAIRDMIHEMEQEMTTVDADGEVLDITGTKGRYREAVMQPEAQAQALLRQYASTLERMSLNEDVASRKKEKWSFFNPTSASSMQGDETTSAISGDVDLRCREVLREMDRLNACTKKFVDSSVLHGTLQRFPTTVLMAELGRELDRLLKNQIYERESGVLAKFRNNKTVENMLAGDDSGSDYDSDDFIEPEFSKELENSKVSTVKPSTTNDIMDVEDNPLYCKSCRSIPCHWKPSVNLEEVVDRLRLVQSELEVIRQLDPSVKFVNSEQALSVVRGGKSRMHRRDLMDELGREVAALKRQQRICKVDQELHEAYANSNDFMETKAIHGYPQMQWTMNVISALEEERNRILADEMAGEMISDVLDWMLDGWMFGEREEFVPNLNPEGRKRTRVDKDGKLLAIKDVAEITEVALVRSVAKKLQKEKSELDHQLDETENTLKFGLFMISLMYFRSMTLLRKSSDAVSGKTSLKNAVGASKAGNSLVTPERQKMLLEKEMADQRNKRIKAAMQQAQNGISRRLIRIEKEKQVARAKLREKLLKVTRETKASTMIQKVVRGHLGRIAMSKFALRAKELVEQKKLEYAAVVAIQRIYRGHQARCFAQDRFAEIAAFIAKLREDEAAEEEREYWRRHYVKRWARDARELVVNAPDEVLSRVPGMAARVKARREDNSNKGNKYNPARAEREKKAKKKLLKDRAKKRFEDRQEKAKQIGAALSKRITSKVTGLQTSFSAGNISKVAPAG